MVSKLSTVEFIIGNISAPGELSAKRMFGEYGIYCADKMVALVCDDQLFIKPTPGGKAFLNECVEVAPYPGAKPCFVIPEEKWSDSAWLSQLIALTYAQLPAAKKKAPKKST
ncbi:TfoX/Sxy family protein [Serratia sp. FDAARGOS_506]|uniref:TfoX/Sxy family protein n=1 Tax=Serratia sp. FDAARGOS_506 TaxID=2420306 RepID=UPI000F4F3108|nr:TfoX/Sxy family protein [Serratia sp. FDAARGOS_506]AYZ32504.1 TfoX family protein [Serratia sp. FDAARGOS_506]HAT4981739.1 TfoX/Sxy family protein [Serratia marcescens]HAT5029840.1 TfoX/Sxy family protein [Serratia marcescens]